LAYRQISLRYGYGKLHIRWGRCKQFVNHIDDLEAAAKTEKKK
jgi:hypothetical protein